MAINGVNAASAYASALERVRDLGAASELPQATPAAASAPFGEILQDALQHSKEIAEAGEGQAMKAAADGADLVDVVTAVNNAEVTLQTVVAVRDRVVQAYEQIIRMPM